MRLYLSKTQPNSPANRVPWYRYLAPCYAALFLWFGFYEDLARGTIDRAPLGLIVFGLFVASIIGYGLFSWIPSKMGMQTGYPVGVLGSSTFGSQGGLIVPGLLVGLVQIAWLGATAFLAARAVTAALGKEGGALSPVFLAVVVGWCVGFSLLGRKGLRLAAAIGLALSPVPILVLLYGFYSVKEGLGLHGLDLPQPYAAFTLTVHLATAFFATAAVASPGLGRHAQSVRHLKLGGLIGIIIPMTFAGGIGIMTVAGSRALNPQLDQLGEFGYLAALQAAGGLLGSLAPFALLVASIPAAAVISWMTTDSFTVMAPGWSADVTSSVIAGAAVLVAISGFAADMQIFVTVTGALCAPLCGIMAADYWTHDKRWPHTRPGINYAGYGAWLLGLIVGLAPLAPLPEHMLAVFHPAAVFSFVAGFAGYVLLGNMGLKPYRKHRRKRVRMSSFESEGAEQPRERRQSRSKSHGSSRSRTASVETTGTDTISDTISDSIF